MLASANVTYFGSAVQATDYFKTAGYDCPIHYNPADFILELVTDNFGSEDKENIKNELIETWKKYTTDNQTLIYKENVVKAVENKQFDVRVDDIYESNSRWNTSWFQQFKILYTRGSKHRRGHLWSWILFVEIGGISVLGGLVWFRIEHIEANIQDYMAASFFITSYLMFSVMYRGVVHFPLEKEVLKKERQSGAYRLSAYYVSKIVAEFPVDICFPMIACTIFYWLVGMSDDFPTYLWYLATTAMALLAANSFGIMCGCSVPTFDYALTILVVVGLFMMALAGFMIKDRAIPVWIRWIKYFSFIRYGYLGGVMTLLHNVAFDCDVPSAYSECLGNDASGYIEGAAILSAFEVDESYWLSMVLLLGLTFVFFSIAYLFLKKTTSTKVYN